MPEIPNVENKSRGSLVRQRINQIIEAVNTLKGVDNITVVELGVADPNGEVTASPVTVGVTQSGDVWAKLSGDGNTGWRRVFTANEDGKFVASVKLEDVSDSVPDTGVLARVGNSLRIGNNSETGGIYPLDSSTTVTVLANGTPSENGAAFLAAIARAKSLTPHGPALSASNRGNLVMMPGIYEIPSSNYDADFVNIIAMPGAVLKGTLELAADNFDIHGLTVEGNQFMAPDQFVGTNGANVRVAGCKIIGDWAFGDGNEIYIPQMKVRDCVLIGDNNFYNFSGHCFNVEVIGGGAWSREGGYAPICDHCKAGSGGWKQPVGGSP